MTLAEDQVAEAFARAWASWPKVSHHPAPRAWVVRTALNAGASWWHRRREETAQREIFFNGACNGVDERCPVARRIRLAGEREQRFGVVP